MTFLTNQTLVIASLSGGVASGFALSLFDKLSLSIEAPPKNSEGSSSTSKKVIAIASSLLSGTVLGAGLGALSSVVVNASRSFLTPNTANFSEVKEATLVSALWGTIGTSILLSIYKTCSWNWMIHQIDHHIRGKIDTHREPLKI